MSSSVVVVSINSLYLKVTEREAGFKPLSAPWAEFQMIVGCGTRTEESMLLHMTLLFDCVCVLLTSGM